MRVFFKKHGTSVFYLILPVLFLVLTLAFIQLTPRESISTPGDVCANDNECCTASGCGNETLEICDDGFCIRTNVFCPTGSHVDQSNPADCFCRDDVTDQVVQDCNQCAPDELPLDGVCTRICTPDEDPDVDNCVDLVQGSGCGSSLDPYGLIAPNYTAIGGIGYLLYGFLVFRLRRKS